MGFLDKLKNVFFEEVEEEEIEKEEPVKLAKKIELPKRKVDKVIEDWDREPVKEPVVSVSEVNPIKEETYISIEEEEVVPMDYGVNNNVNTINNKLPMMFEEDIFDDNFKEEPVEVQVNTRPVTREEKVERRELYQGKKEASYIESVTKTPAYTYTKSYYENKESKVFKPSPIISPIYGILDKNYRKEEVVTKKEIKVNTNKYKKVDLDSVRNKAFGQSVNEVKEPKEIKEKEIKVEPKREEQRVYDINKSKPSADKITLADADEYYNDLGLAYNVDYSDASRSQLNTRTKRYHEDSNDYKSDDNLFDLIDSMYSKED